MGIEIRLKTYVKCILEHAYKYIDHVVRYVQADGKD